MLLLFLIIGLAGALLMFIGDMVLYYNKNDYVADGTLYPIIEIMKKESRLRLYFGGMLGPIAAFIYCAGYYHIVLFISDKNYIVFGWICFIINCMGIICGGAYHSHCANLGLIGRLEDQEAMSEVLKFMNVQKMIAFGVQAIGFVLLIVLIGLGWTTLPRWMIILSPGILALFTPVMRKLPKGYHMILCGGWTNLISVIYYAAAIIVS